MKKLYLVIFFVIKIVASNDEIQTNIFKNNLQGLPAAFGDFNSDRLIDIFLIDKNRKNFNILLAIIEEPLFLKSNLTCSTDEVITSIVPGDYNGDKSMDILVTTTRIKKKLNKITNVYVIWGNDNHDELNCSSLINKKPYIQIKGEPLIVDYNNDMTVDIFATNINDKRAFWSFKNDHFEESNDEFPTELPSIRVPHANAFLDLNNDYYSDLFVTTDSHFEVWSNDNNRYLLSKNISWTDGGIDISNNGHIGQSIFLDVQRKGKMNLIVPVCHDEMCRNSSIFIYDNRYYNLNINFTNEIDNEEWSFLSPNKFSTTIYNNMITLRAGDYNIDGYPDLLATLISKKTSKIKSFLLINHECTNNCDGFNRTFKIQWKLTLGEFNNDTVMAVFYDFHQNGILDIIMVSYDEKYNEYSLDTFINDDNYDATFIQVMVTSANLPGPSVSYIAAFLDDTKQTSTASQLSQSAHFSLNLPYIILGLGRTTNVVEELDIGISGSHRSWDRIIPNMQLVVTPQPLDDPSEWTIRQFIRINDTLKTVAIFLLSLWICLIAVIYLFWLNECKEDRIERKQNALNFHFEAL